MTIQKCAFDRCGLRKPINQMLYMQRHGKRFCSPACFEAYLRELVRQESEQSLILPTLPHPKEC